MGGAWEARHNVKNVENDQIRLSAYTNGRYAAPLLWAVTTGKF